MAFITKWDIVHQNDSTDTICNDFNKPNGIKNMPHNIIQDLRGVLYNINLVIAFIEKNQNKTKRNENENKTRIWTYRESSAPSGNVPAIKSPQTTTYKMHVINNSMICAMLTSRAPIFGPKHTFAMET